MSAITPDPTSPEGVASAAVECIGFLTPHRHQGEPPGIHFVYDNDRRECVLFRPCPACSRHGWHQIDCPSVQPTTPLVSGDNHNQADPPDLDAIEARAKDAQAAIYAGDLAMIQRGASQKLAREDVPALVAEVRRLREIVEGAP